MKKTEKKSKVVSSPASASKDFFPVVGVGASAGGLEAFKKLIKAIPANSGMAYILVQHLHPGFESALPEILQRETAIPVVEISNNIKIYPDHIFVIPSNKILAATDGMLKLSDRKKDEKPNMIIDTFFSTLAEVHQSFAVGVILSGTGSDGTAGLKDIKNQGGYTFAQTMESASYDGMPQHAIEADVIDFVLAPENIPAKIIELQKSFSIPPLGDDIVLKDKNIEEGFRQILALLRIRMNIDFNFYKQTTVRRRIIRRMVILHLETLTQYLDYLKNNKTELDILFQDLLIPVTSFFRDHITYDILGTDIIPQLIKDKSVRNPLRAWVAGCSTGQEAYSIAMYLYDYINAHQLSVRVQIFATDISEKSIIKARTGIYTKKELDDINESQIPQYFNKIDGSYQVKKAIRDMCIFAVQNFLKDPPFAKMDFISCRNVLIYFTPFLQRKALTVFHYSLNEKGILWLGKSETQGNSSELFIPYGKDKFYVRKQGSGKFMNVASERSEAVATEKNLLQSKEIKSEDFQKNADEILLSKYTPAGVVIDNQWDIVQFRGAVGDFLEPSPGKASLNILRMAKDGLAFELRNALQKAKVTKETFLRSDISLNNNEYITIEVVPLVNMTDLHYLVLFKKQEGLQQIEITATGTKKTKTKTDRKDARIHQLEKELAQAREDMRSITEEQEAANEELQSSNEELLSGSEELQSLNEELETSKEELQSTNEELITVNQELYDRNEQLSQLRTFAEATVSVLHEPLLVLNKDFIVTSANNAFYKTFEITEEQTLGKNLFTLQNNKWNIPSLHDELLNIKNEKEKSISKELEFTSSSGGKRTILFNMQPIKRENGEKLILLAMDDITERKDISKNLNEQLLERKQSEKNLRLILQFMPQMMVTFSPAGVATFFNQYFLDYSGLTFDEATIGSGWKFLIHPSEMESLTSMAKHSFKTGEDFYKEIRIKRFNDGTYRWNIAKGTPIKDKEGKIISWIGTAMDIHEQKLKEQKKDQFISVASHEMKTPLTTAMAYLQLVAQSIDKGNDNLMMYTRKATESVQRLNSLIAELLDVSKIQHGRLAYKVVIFDFNKLVDETIQSILYSSPEFIIEKKGSLGRQVAADKDRLQQVLINLFSNAIKYSAENHKIEVSIKEDEETFTVAVKDFGIGITRNNLTKIFDRYYRVEDDAVHSQGLGIGLFISQEIIQRHGGRLWAESEPGKESIFYFSMPFTSDPNGKK